MNHILTFVNKKTIKPGDTIMFRGKMRTVNASDIKQDELMGLTIFGDSFMLGYDLVKKVIFK